MYDNVSEARKNNHIYVWVEKNDNVMHSQAKGFVETSIKQKGLKSIRSTATVL